MTVLIETVRNIVVIILLTAFLEMILPSSSMQRFVKMVLGLFVLVALLNPILKLINYNEDFEVFSWQQNGLTQFETVQERGERLHKTNEDLLLQEYQQRLEGQMKALIILHKDLKRECVKVSVELDKNGQEPTETLIYQVHVIIEKIAPEQEQQQRTTRETEKGESTGNEQEQNQGNSIELVKPVEIAVGHHEQQEDTQAKTAADSDELGTHEYAQVLEREIINTLCEYFRLSEKQITVDFQ